MARAFIRGVDDRGDGLWRITVREGIDCPPGAVLELSKLGTEGREDFYRVEDDRRMTRLWETRWWLEHEGVVAYATRLLRCPLRPMGGR